MSSRCLPLSRWHAAVIANSNQCKSAHLQVSSRVLSAFLTVADLEIEGASASIRASRKFKKQLFQDEPTDSRRVRSYTRPTRTADFATATLALVFLGFQA